MPSAFHSIWSDLYWIGAYGGNYAPNVTGTLLWLLGPVGFNKFIVPVAFLLAGLGAGVFFCRLGFTSAVVVLAGIAAALNSNFFSNGCWGLSSRSLCLAATFLALAAVQSAAAPQAGFKVFIKVILAGLAIGLSISEGGDNGAIFSLFVAAYAAWSAWCQPGPAVQRLWRGGWKVALMAVCAGILAAQTLNVFVGTAVKGIVGTEQNAMTKEGKWNWATQWSLPKMETLRVVVPGLFGYRLDSPEGGEYWGGVGQDPAWPEGHKDPNWVRSNPQAFPRHSGAGEYAGVLVVLIALWALAHSRTAGGAFTETERRMIWFWGGAAFITPTMRSTLPQV